MRGLKRGAPSVVAVAAVLALGACDDVAGPEALGDAAVLDMAVLAADATVEDVTLWAQPFGFGPFLIHGPEGPGRPGGLAGRPGGGGGFSGEFSGTRSVTFFDAEGNEQDAYDELETASIEIVHEIEGSITRDVFTATIERSRSMTVSGLEGTESERTWNGSGTESMSRSGVLEDGTERSHDVEGTFTYSDVVVPIPGTEPRYPLSGTVTRSMTATRTTEEGTQTRTVEIVVTFDGTSTATVSVNGEVMEIDLSTRDGRSPLRRRRG